MPRRTFVRQSGRMPSALKAEIRRLVAAVGDVIWAANFAQAALGILFSQLIRKPGLDSPDSGLAIWNSLRNDTAQRDALMAVCEELWKSPHAARIMWACDKASKLSKIRNDAAHIGVLIEPDRLYKLGLPAGLGMVSLVIPAARSRRLRAPDIIRVFRVAAADYYRLGDYCNLLYFGEVFQRHALPRRPRIRSDLRRN